MLILFYLPKIKADIFFLFAKQSLFKILCFMFYLHSSFDLNVTQKLLVLVCINVVLLIPPEHSNNGQILHQNYNEEDGGTP